MSVTLQFRPDWPYAGGLVIESLARDGVYRSDFGGPEMLPQLSEMADASGFDDLDECVEAHVHSGVVIERDVEAVVLDPCFRDTAVEAAAARLGCAVEWHPGFRVATDGLDPGYRGQEYVDLARSLGDVLTPDLLGDAARSGDYDPQSVKRVWHYLARFGRAESGSL